MMSFFKSLYLPEEEKQSIWNNVPLFREEKNKKSESIYSLIEVEVRETPDNLTTEILEEGRWSNRRTLLKNAEVLH